MGKYIKKVKTTPEDAVMDLSQSSLGVRTRAKTLALQRLQQSSTPPSTKTPSPAPDSGDVSYLQLRSRRLEKLSVDLKKLKQQEINKEGRGENPNPYSDVGLDVEREEIVQHINGNDNIIIIGITNNNEIKDFDDIEASFGENVLDIEARERGTRESTPCNLIRVPESIRTPGSTTRPTSSEETNRRVHNAMHEHIPTAHEMDEFFSIAEAEQQRQFIEKYNFDPVKDEPLQGRYEWVELDPQT